jgi:hypothetical protein
MDDLEEHGDDVRIARRHLFDRRRVVQRHAHEPFDQRLEAGLHLGIAGGRQRRDGAAVEGLLVDHDLGALDALVVAVLARDLDRAFVRLEAGIAEEDVGQAGDLAQLGGQALLQGRAVVVGGVDQLAHLLLQRGHQLGVGVSQRVDRDAGERIEVLLAVGVPDPAASAVRQGHRQAAVGLHHMGLGIGGQLVGGVHGERAPKWRRRQA